MGGVAYKRITNICMVRISSYVCLPITNYSKVELILESAILTFLVSFLPVPKNEDMVSHQSAAELNISKKLQISCDRKKIGPSNSSFYEGELSD